MVDSIEKKNNELLTDEEIHFIIAGYTEGIPDTDECLIDGYLLYCWRSRDSKADS